ncbi:MAG: homoserine kinase [Chloroflexi bacterium]|nr:homoserine kinase [Chloroflexota bacterium]
MKVTVKVPATSANLGPGFDCLGMALDFGNTITVELAEEFSISVTGEGTDTISRGPNNRVYSALTASYEKVGRKAPPLAINCHNEIPVGRGLGSSASAIVGGLMAANTLCGGPLSMKELVAMAALLEGHADNVVPAFLGGCQVIVHHGGELVTSAIPFPQALRAVLFIPDFQMPTEKSRALLPQQVSRADAVHNISRAALLVASLCSSNLEHLSVATQDKLHQPTRQTLFPAMPRIFEAALAAGAKGVFLSGGGPTILAFVADGADKIGEAMRAAAEKEGVHGRVKIASVSPMGARVVSEAD